MITYNLGEFLAIQIFRILEKIHIQIFFKAMPAINYEVNDRLTRCDFSHKNI